MREGLLVVLSGPSGCGKGTMLAEAVRQLPCAVSVSATTRPMRPGEVDGVHYHFLTREAFEQRIAAGEMLEYAEYCGNYYGTPRDAVDALRRQGKHVVLEIEVQGAMQVMQACPDAVSVFTIPPSIDELRRRLQKRGTEDAATIEKRIARAMEELPLATHYRYIVLNDKLEQAVSDFCAILQAETLTAARLDHRIGEMIHYVKTFHASNHCQE